MGVGVSIPFCVKGRINLVKIILYININQISSSWDVAIKSCVVKSNQSIDNEKKWQS
jgi:hypothetical protein